MSVGFVHSILEDDPPEVQLYIDIFCHDINVALMDDARVALDLFSRDLFYRFPP